MKIILASQSPSRTKLLTKAGLPFEVCPSHINEDSFLDPKYPSESCLKLARMKALVAQKKYPQQIIIGCDQMAYLKPKFFGKAHTEKKAIENLIQLQGKTHTLFTAVGMLWKEQSFYHVSKSFLTMRSLTVQQIKNYIKKEQPLNSAGSYHIEAKGITLFEKIKTEDFNSIEGLPLIQVINQLIKWDYPLWNI